SYRYIETPARQARLSFPALLRAAAPAAGVLAACGMVFHATSGFPARMPKGVIQTIAASVKEAALGRAGCRNEEAPVFGLRTCPIGAPASGMQYDFILWGDSHSGHLTGAFAGQASSLGLAGLVIWFPFCPPFVNETGVAKDCRENNESVVRWLRTQRKLKMVFLAGGWSVYVKAGRLAVPPSEDIAEADISIAKDGKAGPVGLRDTAKLLRSLNMNFAIMEDVPRFPLRIFDCVGRAQLFGRSGERCFKFPRHDIEKGTEQTSLILREISRRYNAPIVQTVHAFCEGDTCRTEKDGVILFADNNHLTSAGARYLGTRIDIPWPANQAVQDDPAGGH
ncbi:MAG: SGNH hydrolase domain-containing protein, partial [Rhodomicrobium sp.]